MPLQGYGAVPLPGGDGADVPCTLADGSDARGGSGWVGSHDRAHLGATFERMFVLGIDPGLSRCGYGLVARMPGSSELRACAAGVIETDPRDPLPTRLLQAQRALDVLFEELSPSAAAVERVFFQVNARTAVSVCQVSGLALAAAAAHGCEVAEYSANEVKQALVGYGSATKRQVQQMVASVLGLADAPRPPDVADALALAMCHLAIAPVRAAIRSASGVVGRAS